MTINRWYDLPAIGFEAARRVISEPSLDLAIDGDPVVIINRNQFAQAEGAGQ